MSEKKPSIATAVQQHLAQRFRITRVYMLTGLVFLGPAWISLIHASVAISQNEWHHPSFLAAIHLFVVGFALTVVYGAIVQIVPVVFQGRLYSIRLGYVQYMFTVLGACSFPVGFLAEKWNVVAAGGCLVLVSFVLLCWNLGQSIRTLKKRTEALGITATFLFLLITVILGIGMSLGASLGNRSAWSIHIIVGVTGWFTTLILALTPRLMSFFVSSHYKKLRHSKPEFLFLGGMLAVVAGTALKDEGMGVSVAVGLSVGGWIVYGWGYFQLLMNLYIHFRRRRRQDVEWILNWIVAGLYGGFPVLGIWAIASSRLGDRWTLAVMMVLIFGFLQWCIAAYMAKIMPFLRRAGRYPHGTAPETDRGSRKRPPAIRDMIPKTPTVTALLGYATGAIFLLTGVLIGQAAFTLAGAIVGTVAWILYVAAMVIMYQR
ncbi:hypothetical protein [Novibacillus thermophilus]|uniref:Uncharacterized protein n=1 Tax=Novibacillus thermophilus TaxID=1471761 RepID=A0A1U9K6T9_9BACL|nr:hypothetical protein [Novibacillus thermophilus]AQS55775.1 hypothetical protein B0W44_08215 [Novibacillus thermophilus]